MHLEGQCELEILDSAGMGLPLFDQDLERVPAVRERIRAAHRRFARADGLIIASPEHNGLPSAFLKSLVDWVSRLPYLEAESGNAFEGRPTLLCSASTGWSGGAVAIPHVRALMGYLGAVVLGDTICVPHAETAWMCEGVANDPMLDERIATATSRLIKLASALTTTRCV